MSWPVLKEPELATKVHAPVEQSMCLYLYLIGTEICGYRWLKVQKSFNPATGLG